MLRKFRRHIVNHALVNHFVMTFDPSQTDWELHGAFFECIVAVVTHLRHHSLSILEPLLQQVHA